jgi:hypothetical protein
MQTLSFFPQTPLSLKKSFDIYCTLYHCREKPTVDMCSTWQVSSILLPSGALPECTTVTLGQCSATIHVVHVTPLCNDKDNLGSKVPTLQQFANRSKVSSGRAAFFLSDW